MLSLETSRNIQKISFIFFILLGAAHLLSGMAALKGYFPEQAIMVNRVLLIPFVLSTLSYAFSSLKANLIEWGHTSSFWDYLFITITFLVFAGLIAIEFIFPDS